MEEHKLLDNYSNTVKKIDTRKVYQKDCDIKLSEIRDDEQIREDTIIITDKNDVINLKERRISFIEKMLNIEIPKTPEIKHRILSCNSDRSPVSFNTDNSEKKVIEKTPKNVELEVQSPFNFRVRFNTNESIESVSSTKKNS